MSSSCKREREAVEAESETLRDLEEVVQPYSAPFQIDIPSRVVVWRDWERLSGRWAAPAEPRGAAKSPRR